MKVLICPDKFKGSVTSLQAAKSIEKGIKRYDRTIETILHPLADGGEGSIDIFGSDSGVSSVEVKVSDPLGREIIAFYRRSGRSAYIEMAIASGVALLHQSELDVMNASSVGTGQLILHALQNGCREIYLFIGGSATNDGGMGIAHTLGYRFLDAHGKVLEPIGKSLEFVQNISRLEVLPEIKNASFYTICDVTNPFYGRNGAAYIYGAQKGAISDEIEILDQGLRNLAAVVKRDLGKDISDLPGAGAAGGIGGGMVAFLGAKIRPGIETIMQLTGFEEKCQNVDLIISGEGKADHQSLQGKVIAGVAQKAKKYGIEFALIVGTNELNTNHLRELDVRIIRDILGVASTLDKAVTAATSILEDLGYEVMRDYFSMNKG